MKVNFGGSFFAKKIGRFIQIRLLKMILTIHHQI
jgi:hypothetical protein